MLVNLAERLADLASVTGDRRSLAEAHGLVDGREVSHPDVQLLGRWGKARRLHERCELAALRDLAQRVDGLLKHDRIWLPAPAVGALRPDGRPTVGTGGFGSQSVAVVELLITSLLSVPPTAATRSTRDRPPH